MYVCTCRIITELLQNDMSSMLWSLKDNQVPKIHQKLVSRLLKQLDISETTTIILQHIEIDCGIDIYILTRHANFCFFARQNNLMKINSY